MGSKTRRHKDTDNAITQIRDASHGSPSTKPDVIKITSDIQQRLNAEAERTGVGPYALLRGMSPSDMQGLSSAIVSHWLHGRIMTGQRVHVDLVLQTWASLPDQGEIWFSVNQDSINTIREELQRTGISQRHVLRGREDIPHGLTFSKFEGFLNGKYKRFRKAHYSYILDLLSGLPTSPRDTTVSKVPKGFHKGRIAITEDMRNALAGERDRTGVGQHALVRHMPQDYIPIDPDKIGRWINGKAKSVHPKEYEEVLSVWRALPANKKC